MHEPAHRLAVGSDKELWEEIPGFPNYLVSNRGQIYNARHRYMRKPGVNQQGLAKVDLFRDGHLHTRSVAVLVANAFMPQENDIFDTPIHLDGDRMNCDVNNLVWRPRWFAIKYHQQFKVQHFHHATPHLIVEQTGEEFHSLKDPAIKYGLLARDIILSYTNGSSVFPIWFDFRQID